MVMVKETMPLSLSVSHSPSLLPPAIGSVQPEGNAWIPSLSVVPVFALSFLPISHSWTIRDLSRVPIEEEERKRGPDQERQQHRPPTATPLLGLNELGVTCPHI